MAIARELLECGCRPKLSPGNLRVNKSVESVLDRYPREGVVNEGTYPRRKPAVLKSLLARPVDVLASLGFVGRMQ